MSEQSEQDFIREQEKQEPDVERFPSGGGGCGFIYVAYFATEAQAAQAVRDFWAARSEGRTNKNFESGMWDATKHQLTMGDRTHPYKSIGSLAEKHPDKPFAVGFNGNTQSLSLKGEEALRTIGLLTKFEKGA